ncbi:monocarboxylate transporter 6 [Aplysia californica]|uniref:Monocarboxylate transporter 6 n=1 Tax=Aplysia californica TaxID=6500 RepID=A0ABM1A9A3_APLCA|nr:monocarboxylate transporter 6 [Aplysia californica]
MTSRNRMDCNVETEVKEVRDDQKYFLKSDMTLMSEGRRDRDDVLKATQEDERETNETTIFDVDDDNSETRLDTQHRTGPNIDKGYAWIVMVASFVVQFMVTGYTRALGVFFVEFQDRFESSSSLTSVVLGIAEAISSVTAFLCMSILVKVVTPRKICLAGSFLLALGVALNSCVGKVELLCLSHGVFFGLALGCLYGPPTYVLALYFDRRRAFVTNFSTSGGGVGGVVFPLLIRRLLDEYAFEGGTLLTAGVLLHTLVFSALLAPVKTYNPDFELTSEVDDSESSKVCDDRELFIGAPGGSSDSALTKSHNSISPSLEISSSQLSTEKQKGKTEVETLKRSRYIRDLVFSLWTPKDTVLLKLVSFWALCIFFFCGATGQGISQSFIPALAKEKGFSDEEGAYLLSLLNILDFPSRMIGGLVVNMGFLSPSQACVGPMLVIGVLGQLTEFYNTYQSLLAMVATEGICMGVYFGMQSLVVIEILGMDHYATAVGVCYLMMGVGGGVSYPLAGMIRDLTGSYSYSFYYMSSMQLLGVLIIFVAPWLRLYDIRRGLLQPTVVRDKFS